MVSSEGGIGARELDQTPTWAVSVVCLVIIVISIILEKLIHLLGEYFQERKKKALFEALEKVKGELMVLGFISLLLTFGQSYISRICIPNALADTMWPCPHKDGIHLEPREEKPGGHEPPKGPQQEHNRRLLWNERRYLAGGGGADKAKSCYPGHVPLISANALHQLHIFIFFLAVFHVIYSAITMALGRLKIREWKVWERETASDPDYMDDPTRFRLTHETSFVREHTSFWTKTPVSFYFVCFFRQFFRSVRRADYLTMRHGFVSVHLAPGSKFDFQKYILRSLEDDFKVVVGISPILWCSMLIFLLVDVSGWHVMVVISVLPLIVILAVGTKLQSVIAQMALEIKERHAVVQGIPLVQVSDRHFWFSRPQLVLYLIHFVLFQNALEITYFFWIWYEFGLRSCFHANFDLIILRVCLGVGVQFMCSYITLPLYALVTQMGSTMKKSIFDEQTSKALKQWRKKAGKKSADGGKPEIQTATLGGTPTGGININESLNNEVETPTSPARTANIMASVDIDGSNQQGYGQRDLLS